jgi:hypothetical protein
MGAFVEVGRSSGVFADEHDAKVASVTTRATTNRPAQKIMGQPYVQTPQPEAVANHPDLGRRCRGTPVRRREAVAACAAVSGSTCKTA